MLFSCAGCGLPETTASDPQIQQVSDRCEIDAGVVFCDRTTSFCLPLSRIGIASSGEIESLDSSCECVKPTLVRYSDMSATVADGLMLEFVTEDHASGSVPEPMHLAVDVKLKLFGGKSRTVTVNFLHAPLLDQGEL